MRVEELVRMCDAQLVQGDPNWQVRHISTDTRAIERGDCFVALRGPRFDGHDFLNVAAERGASAAVVSYPTRAANSPSALALLQVQDTLPALHKLATNYRRLMPPTTCIIAVTGSFGKTTTKKMTAADLCQRFIVVNSEGNKNNHIGLSLKPLKTDPGEEFRVVH